jgi:integrase
MNVRPRLNERPITVFISGYFPNRSSRNRNSKLVLPSKRKDGERFLDLKKGFKKAVKLAGIPKIRFHDLRHTFATRLVQADIDISTVQHLLGHARISMTARYAHSPDQARVAAVERLDGLFDLQPAPYTAPRVQYAEPGCRI